VFRDDDRYGGRSTASVPVGCDYTFNFIRGDPGGAAPTYAFSKSCPVAAGQTTDVGEVRMKGDDD